jgi:sugar phosphate isomerase/epimerase
VTARDADDRSIDAFDAMRTLTLGFLNCPEVDPLALVDVAADAAFDSVGLRITGRRLGDSFRPIVGNAAALAEIRERARSRGMRIANISAYHCYPEIGRDKLEPLVDATAALGSDMILVSGYDPDHERFGDMLSEYADIAAQRGIRLFLEFVPFSQVKSLPAAVAIVRRVGKPNLGMIVDPLHLARSGGTPDDVAAVPRDRLFFAQLCDAQAATPAGMDLPTEARTGRLAPGDGELPLARLLDALPANLELECEFPTSANLRLPPVARARAIRSAALRFLAERD